MPQNPFIDSWELISSEFRSSDEDIYYPLGKNVGGVLTYDSLGNMTAQLARSGRLNFASENLQNGTPEEIKQAFEGYAAYFGAYEIKEDEGVILHHVKGALFPNWIGSVQKRFYTFSENTLTLRTPPILFNDVSLTGALSWERAV